MLSPELAADLDLIIARRGAGFQRFRLLADSERPEYRDGYADWVRAEAARLRGEPTHSPDPPTPAGAQLRDPRTPVLACPHRTPLGTSQPCGCGGELAACGPRGRWPGKQVALAKCLTCVAWGPWMPPA